MATSTTKITTTGLLWPVYYTEKEVTTTKATKKVPDGIEKLTVTTTANKTKVLGLAVFRDIEIHKESIIDTKRQEPTCRIV